MKTHETMKTKLYTFLTVEAEVEHFALRLRTKFHWTRRGSVGQQV
jgi:hypothetical protein